jgi:aldose 1-epimerase
MRKVILLTLTLVSAIFIACNQSPKIKEKVKKEVFGTLRGKEVYLLTLTNKAGNVIKLSNFGARITWIEVPDKTGKKENIAFGYDKFDDMINGEKFFGSVVGRYANRIAKGKFSLDGTEYSLTLNNGPNALHGGPGGFHSVVWNTEIVQKTEFPTVKFTYRSPDMEEGYPGNMDVEVTYSWTDKNEIVINYKCTTDKKTVLNITNHAYFNLHGAGVGDILDHEVTIKASSFTPLDSTLIPTGELLLVTGTPFDFTSPHMVGERINDAYDQLIMGKGYDHNYVLDSKEEVDAVLYEPVSGRIMEVITDQPAIQLYSGNFLTGKIGYGGKPYNFRTGLCLETQHYPDSPNHPAFPSTVLNPGETFKSTTIYRFSVK